LKVTGTGTGIQNQIAAILKMNRRNTIKTLMMASAGMISLPAWAREWSSKEIDLSSLPAFLLAEETAILTAVAGTIIPASDAIGALDVEVDTYLIKLFTNCYDPAIQENLKLQFNKLQASAMETFAKPYPNCTQTEREGLLLAMSTSEDQAQVEFFNLMKGETIRGFLTSRKVMREYLDYVVAPGHFYGCVDISIT
jgi:hypothetical protein